VGKFFRRQWQIYFIACIIFALLTAVFTKKKFAPVFLFIAFVAAGSLHFQIKNQIVSPNRIKRIYDENRINSGDPMEIEGVLQNKPELAVGGFFLILKSEKAIYKESEIKISGNIRLFAPFPNDQIKSEYDRLYLNYGSRIRVACRLKREDNFLNAGVISQKELLDQRDIDATAIKKPAAHRKNCRYENICAARLDL
jgi:hypothetical protein